MSPFNLLSVRGLLGKQEQQSRPIRVLVNRLRALSAVFVNIACRSHQYQCTNGRCIYREWMCDGVADCPLGDDELPSRCSKIFAVHKLDKKLS